MNKKILIVDDDLDVLSALKMLLTSEEYNVELMQTPNAAIAAVKKDNFDLILMDLNYSRDTTSGEEGMKLIEDIRKIDECLPIVVMTGWASIEVAVSTMQNGANDFVQKPWDIDRLIAIIKGQLKLAESEKNTLLLKQENQLLKQQVTDDICGEIICESSLMKKVMSIVDQVANSHASVLLTGENGTGKSMFARYIHDHSPRHNRPQISVNMGAISESLFESEMFGHVKGAFTDAKSTRVGRFELANQGTLFLDEIANTPYSQQGKLLRVLENSEFEKVGASKTQSVDIRLISATNADLSAAVAHDRFRKDLLYRINTIVIEIPPLRARTEDIILLAESFIAKKAVKQGKSVQCLSESAKQALLAYEWPGNIRELSHVIERAQILCVGETINIEDLGLPDSKKHRADIQSNVPLAEEALVTLAEIEVDAIDKRLSYFNGNALKAAKSLGLSRSAFYRRLEKI